MPKRYILRFKNENDFHAGSKAVADCERIWMREGYEVIHISLYTGRYKIVNKIKNLLKYIALLQIEKSAIVVIQHPQYVNPVYLKFLQWTKKLKKCKYILLIHDIESLRKLFINELEKFQKLDEASFDMADIIIAHNTKMIRYLIEERNIPEQKIINLKLFDYLLDSREKKEASTEKKGIVIAGNLAKDKAGYIYELDKIKDTLEFHLYGVNLEEGEFEKLQYKGFYSPEELPEKLEGGFGLVWDGNSIETCGGTTGNYVRYNNPHKVSLYIAAGVPVIIWQEAALAEFIVENHLGIAVQNLNDLEEKLCHISDEEYQEMKYNLENMSKKVRNGEFLKEAIKKAEKELM